MTDRRELLKWNSEVIVRFLNIYKTYDCLWNITSEDYPKKEAREACYNRLLDRLQAEGFGNISHVQLKNKIKSLKDAFRIELNKTKRSDSVYRPKLTWFPVANSFWGSVIVTRDRDREPYAHPDVSQLQTKTEEEVMEVQPSCSNNGAVEQEEEPPLFQRNTPRPSTRGRRRRFGTRKKQDVTGCNRPAKVAKSEPNRLERTVHQLQDIASVAMADHTHADQYDTFGSHVAAQLREMPLRSFVLLQGQIQQLITAERLRLLDNNQSAVAVADQTVFCEDAVYACEPELDQEDCDSSEVLDGNL